LIRAIAENATTPNAPTNAVSQSEGTTPARRRRGVGWLRVHITGMGLSYILLLTAFYVDNGKSLPLWKELPTIAYWLLPAAVGLPLIIRAVLRHPLVCRHTVW
jgi:hypothetical protein